MRSSRIGVGDTVVSKSSYTFGSARITLSKGVKGKVLAVNSDNTYKVKWAQLWVDEKAPAAILIKK